MSRHRKRAFRLRTAPLEEVRQSDAAGIEKARDDMVQSCQPAESERFDALYAKMQDPAVQEATAEALRSMPEEMGRAAVKAAKTESTSRP